MPQPKPTAPPGGRRGQKEEANHTVSESPLARQNQGGLSREPYAYAEARLAAYPAMAAAAIPAAAILGLWELATYVLQIPQYILPAPSAVLGETLNSLGLLIDHGAVTLLEVTVGFGISIAVGLALAAIVCFSKALEAALYPLLVASQTIPKIAIGPLLIVWFGFGLTPKIIIVVLIAFFPIVISAIIGLKSSPPELLQLARSMGASEWQVFRKIRFPNALPSIFAGLEVAATLAVVGAVVGEFIGSSRGLGYLIQVAMGRLDTPLMFSAIFALTLMGSALFFVVHLIERRMLWWHSSMA